MTTRDQLQQAIAVQESLRGTIDDAIIDATVTALRLQLEGLAPEAPPAPQRKLATILFIDIAGHTGLIQQLDPEEIMELVDGALQRLAKPVAQFGGQIVRYQGDGFKAVFGLPVASEKDPDHAIRAGLAMIQLAAEIGERWEARGLPGFNVRVGIDTGLVLAGGGTEGQDAVTGLPVNLAARLESAAAPGTVLISHHTYQHVRGVFDLQVLEKIRAKGFDEPIAVYSVLRPKTRSFRTRRRGVEGVDTRMVGRDTELLRLEQAFEEVLNERRFRMVTVVGEAGLGKSRLLSEFENWVDLYPANIRLHRGRARPETQRLPYGLLRDMIAFRFGIMDDDPPPTVEEKLIAGLQETLGPDNAGPMQAHFVGHLLSYDFSHSPYVQGLSDNPQRVRGQALSYLTAYFKAQADLSPVLVLLEDIHWADDSSLDVIPGFVRAMSDRPLLVVAAARPELYMRRPGWMDDQPWHERLSLQLLSPPSSLQLVDQLLRKISDVPHSLRDLLVSRAEGNPFYIEELVKMLIEDGVIVKDEPFWRVMPDKLAAADVPPTLTGILQARLDGLPAREKEALQRASVVGRLFWDAAVDFMEPIDQPLATMGNNDLWRELRTRDFIFVRDESSFEDTNEFGFIHALLRDVTYQTVLRRLRAHYHQRAAEWLIAASKTRADEYADLIAAHFAQAGNTADETIWQIRAGKNAATRYAHTEALHAFARALELTPPENLAQRFDLLLQREAIYNLQGEREKQVADIAELQALAAEMANPQRQTEAALREAAYLSMIGDYRRGLEVAYAAAEWADANNFVELQAAVHLRLGTLLMRSGEYESAEAHLQRALVYCEAGDSRRIEMDCLRLLGVLADEMGNHDEEKRYFERALELAISLHDRWGERRALNSLGVTLYGLGQLSRARTYYEKSLGVARELGDRLGEATVLGNLGTLAATIGDYEQAESTFRDALEIANLIEDLVGQCTLLLNLGSVVTSLDRPEEAIAFYEEALLLSVTMGDRPTVGYVLAGQGFAFLALGRLDEATTAFEQSIALRDEMGQSHLVIESRAGLAAVYLAQSDLTGALSEIDQVLQFLETGTLEISEEYSRILHIAFEVMKAAHDPREREILDLAYQELQKTAAGLDESSRDQLLQNVAWNRQIVAAWQAEHSPQ